MFPNIVQESVSLYTAESFIIYSRVFWQKITVLCDCTVRKTLKYCSLNGSGSGAGGAEIIWGPGAGAKITF